MIQIFKTDNYFEKRLKFLIPFYAIRWSLIVLNDFKVKNKNNYYINNKIKEDQLKKAIFFCHLVKSKKYKEWLN